MLGEKGRKARYDEETSEGDGTAETQAARQGCGGATRCEFGFVGFFDGAFGAFIEVPARFGWHQAARRTQQQPRPEPVLELCDRLGNGGLTEAQLLGRAGERAGIDDANKCFHRGEAVHAYSLQE